MSDYFAPFDPSQSVTTLWKQLEPQLTDLATPLLQQQIGDQVEQILLDLADSNADAYPLGQQLLCLLIGNYPQFTPLIERQLLWFFGGDCLHFLSDDEIGVFQQQEDDGSPIRGAAVPLH